MKEILKHVKNNKTQIILILIVLLVVLISASAVNAASTVYVSTGGSDSNSGNETNPFLTIAKGVNSADENGTVNIADGTYAGENNTKITINKNMAIIGQSQTGTIINGECINWIFNITSGVNVTIKNLTLANGTETYFGGAIYNNGTLNVENCNFINNTVTNPTWGMGGAICNFGNLTVTGSTFTGNTATYFGGAICNVIWLGDSGSITSTLIDCTFVDNSASAGGAVVYVDATAFMGSSGSNSITGTMTGCDFIDNIANSTSSGGGAILNNGNLTIANCNFIANIANSTSSGGGAILNSGYLTVTGCDFILNFASTGGAIYNQGYLTVTGCNFTNNIAVNGGAIYNLGVNHIIDCNVTDSNFTGNIATTSMESNDIQTLFDNVLGDVLGPMNDLIGSLPDFIQGFVSELVGSFESFIQLFIQGLLGPMAISGGGAIYNLGGTLNVDNCNFTANNATGIEGSTTGYGGAILTLWSTSNVTDSNFTGNHADVAGAISNYYIGSLFYSYIVSTLSTVTRCTFTNNTAVIAGAIGNVCGASMIVGSVTSNVIDSTFVNNRATGNGGAISNSGTMGTVISTVTNSDFTGNNATNGGAISNGLDINPNALAQIIFGSGSVNSTVTNSNFIGNNAINGGAIFSYNTISEIHFNRIVGNMATNNGNALYCNNETVNATNNWWGNNINPMTIQNLIYGNNSSVYADPWVILTVKATPITINNGGTSTITADLNHINGGGDLVGGHIPDGLISLYIPWGSFNSSGIIHLIILSTVNGAITPTTFYANEGPVNPLYNPVRVNAIADDYTTNDTEAAYITINKITNLSVTKTGPTTVFAGNQITYTITITNSGPDPSENVQIVDNVPAILQGITHDSFNLGTIPAGESRTIYINGTIPSNTPSGITFQNNATVTSDTPGTITPSQTITTTVDTRADVVLTEIVDKNRPNVGETVTFTVTAHNNGPSDASNIQILDTMPSDFIGVVITPSKGTYNGGIWNLNLTSGENATLTLSGEISVIMAGKNTTDTASLGSNSTNATIYVPKSDLYIKITSDKNNPSVGETFKITYKLGNKGPDAATNVTITIPLPEGFEYTNISGDGNWTYNANTNTITWTLTSVPVGDPYLYIPGHVNKPGAYVFGSSISSETYNIHTQGITPITINAVSEVKAASRTIPMQNTGLPISGLILAIIAVFSGLATSKRK